MFTILKKTAAVILLAGFTFSSSALANGYASYHVTITNLTNSIIFTPILVASQRRAVPIYELGSPAGEDLAAIAEAGDIGPLTSTLNGNHRVVDVQNSGGPLLPGKSVTVVVSAAQGARRISIAAMMLPTNDGFIALDSVRVPRHGSATFFSPGFDAGSEQNDELCTNIPGPVCNGVGPSPGENDGDEGYVHIHRGMHGIGDLAADVYDWRNPVARITVTRVSGY
ncbi:MAG: spondin domain-containing protein [Gammaproteobacteria bacterium]